MNVNGCTNLLQLCKIFIEDTKSEVAVLREVECDLFKTNNNLHL